MKIPDTIAANKKGLICVRVQLNGRGKNADIPIGYEQFKGLDPLGLQAHLDDVLVMMGVTGTNSGKYGLLELPDA